MFTTGYMKPSLLGAVIPVLIIEVVFRYMVLNRYYLAFDSDTIVYLLRGPSALFPPLPDPPDDPSPAPSFPSLISGIRIQLGGGPS